MQDPFIHSSLYLKKIPEINGWGVFTKTTLTKDQVLEVSPVILYPTKLLNSVMYMSVAEGIKEKDIVLDQYAIYWRENGSIENKSALMLGYLSMYNHSNNPNAYFNSDYSDRLVSITAYRDIREDEQITVSYGPDWLEKKKSYINPIDF